MRKFNVQFPFALLLTLMVVFGLINTPASAQDNLLVNPSFDSDVYTPVSFDSTNPSVYLAVPQGWNGGVIQSPRNESWQNIHPTGLPHVGPMKVDGHRSYHVARGGGTFTAYIFQQVTVAPGTPVTGGAWVLIEGTTGYARVGVDPHGGTNPFAPGIVWAGTDVRNNWSTPTVNTVAAGNTVTLFLFASQDFPSNPNGLYWDAAFLRGTAGTPPPATGAPAPSGGGSTVSANIGRLNVRLEPTSNSRILGIISLNEPYPVLGEANGWYRIQFGNREGWVSAQFVNVSGNVPSGQAPAPQFEFGYTTSARLRVRAAPNTDAAELTVIPFNTTVEIVGRTANNSWLQVRYGNVVGWSAGNYGRITGDLSRIPVTG
jgi:uncharacterized protein YraI